MIPTILVLADEEISRASDLLRQTRTPFYLSILPMSAVAFTALGAEDDLVRRLKAKQSEDRVVVVYVVDATESAMPVEVLQTFRRLGIDWPLVFIALDVAPEVEEMLRGLNGHVFRYGDEITSLDVILAKYLMAN